MQSGAEILRAIEPTAWLLVAVGLMPLAYQAGTHLPRVLGKRSLFLVLAVALLLRFLVPWTVINWHFPLMNTVLADQFYTRTFTYLPLVSWLVAFETGAGFDGLLAYNLAIGTLSIVLLWYSALVAGHRPRVASLFALLLALTPLYVRYSASDGQHNTVLFLYAITAASFVGYCEQRLGAWSLVVMVAAVVLGMPIRAESAALFLSAPLFYSHESFRSDWLRKMRVPLLVLVCAGALGAYEAAAIHHEATTRLRLDPLWMLIGLLFRLSCLISPLFPSFFPFVLAIPVWALVKHQVQQRRWKELVSVYLPILFCATPFVASGYFMFVSMSQAGRNIVAALFVLLASARGLDLLLEQRQSAVARSLYGRRGIALAGLGIVTLVWFVAGWSHTYAFMEEFRFLHRELPRQPATILTIWDPEPTIADECCLAMPYGALLAEHPDTQWIVLQRSDLARPDYVRGLHFDYYYPGSMMGLDPEQLTNWMENWTGGPSPSRIEQRASLIALQEVDALVRASHPMRSFRTAKIPAYTWSSTAFPGNVTTLTIYRAGAEG